MSIFQIVAATSICLTIAACGDNPQAVTDKTIISHEVVEETKPKENAELWAVETEESKIDGTKTISASLESDDLFSSSAFNSLNHSRGKLFVRCDAGTLNILIDTGMVLDRDVNDNVAVRYRLEKSEPVYEKWVISKSLMAVFSGDPHKFLDVIMQGSKLYFEAPPSSSAPTTVTFTLTGADTALKPIISACGIVQDAESLKSTNTPTNPDPQSN